MEMYTSRKYRIIILILFMLPIISISEHTGWDDADIVCEVERKDVSAKREAINYPAIAHLFGWSGKGIINLDEHYTKEIAMHDLYMGLPFHIKFSYNDTRALLPWHERSAREYTEIMSHNPNIVFMRGIPHRTYGKEHAPKDWECWLKYENGEPVEADKWAYFLDFTKPATIDWLVEQVISLSKCGYIDGILFDWWYDYGYLLEYTHLPGKPVAYGPEIELQAKVEMLKRIRAEVPEDFLIIGNSGRSKNDVTAKYMNGTNLETGKDYEGGYTHDGLKEIEGTLLWASTTADFREPRINYLQGHGIHTEPLDSLQNRKMMRVLTALTLTMSDGYIRYYDGVDSCCHWWYKFWDADLGRPVGEKGKSYQNIEGLFIREFTNGYAVYNRSSAEREIRLPMVMGVESGIISNVHTIPDLDGEIYLKISVDLNNDGVVNILDLVIVANAFGESEPDINGDNIVNILDLVIIANAFEQ